MDDEGARAEPIAQWEIPSRAGSLNLEAKAGEVMVFVGANGSGKSALAASFSSVTPAGKLQRVLAHRKLWFQNSGPDISASGREQFEQQLVYFNQAPESRYIDRSANQRTDVALFDFLGKVASEDHRIARLSQQDRMSPDEIDSVMGARVFDKLEAVLSAAGLNVRIEIRGGQSFSAVHRGNGGEYSISRMSDGERAALLLSAEVLSAPDSCVIILDEPERHLHRSVSAGLIEALLDARADCCFVVMTHDLDLASSLNARSGETFAVLGLEWVGEEVAYWDIQRVREDESLTESARRAILGGRQRILFVEGADGSLDYSLYRHLFPGWTIAAAGGCEWVIRSVEGLRSAAAHHWVHAAGVIDGDGREETERLALASKNVWVLPCSEVESLYYLPEVIRVVARRRAAADGTVWSDLYEKAISEGLRALRSAGVVERLALDLAKKVAFRKIRDFIMPDLREASIEVKFSSPYDGILTRLREQLASDDFAAIVREVSFRDSGFRSAIAKALGFQKYSLYENAALHAIGQESALADAIRREMEVGGLPLS
ncbi:AAA family ATPase [Sanguibacter inulinus]|uniref:AAA family ATPase n=1 Tax=Sanguibacter inulinus TaxID=60922 RepID=A0A853EXV0_9MICO|nr:AAA family ATPase [Sanguibacter inulinus]MBF0722988.1 AAA family ATPase [Sanguibacter inulinus]NYS94133.1 AAA family ATPase [Sanguibacter inulinus]